MLNFVARCSMASQALTPPGSILTAIVAPFQRYCVAKTVQIHRRHEMLQFGYAS